MTFFCDVVIVPPTEYELLISSGTFLENHNVAKRKLLKVGTYSTVLKGIKRMENDIVETTVSSLKNILAGISFDHLFVFLLSFGSNASSFLSDLSNGPLGESDEC